jgi:hypothetical protein
MFKLSILLRTVIIVIIFQKPGHAMNNLTCELNWHDCTWCQSEIFSCKRVHTIAFVKCSSIHLSSIPVFRFNLNSVKSAEIEITGNPNLRVIPSDSFNQIGVSPINVLRMTRNEIENVSENAFKGLKILKTLDLTSTKVKNLVKGMFNDLEFLCYLNLSENRIEKIEPGAFNVLTGLLTANLSFNLITNLSEFTFSFLFNIT